MNSYLKSLQINEKMPHCFFLYLFLEGVLRKWIIPGAPGTLLYSIKYLLLITIAFFYLLQRHNGLEKIPTPFDRTYTIYGFMVIFRQ